MADEFDEATQSETIRIVVAAGPRASPRDDASRAARLVARLYAGMNTFHRSRMLVQLLRPLGPLARVAVASGAFAGVLGRGMGLSAASALDDLARFSSDQVFELARFVDQVSPEGAAARSRPAVSSNPPPGASALTGRGGAAADAAAAGARSAGAAPRRTGRRATRLEVAPRAASRRTTFATPLPGAHASRCPSHPYRVRPRWTTASQRPQASIWTPS